MDAALEPLVSQNRQQGRTVKVVGEMVSFPLNLNRTELTLVYIICYFDAMDGGDEEKSTKFAILRFIVLARQSSWRGGGMIFPRRPGQREGTFFRHIYGILVSNCIGIVRSVKNEGGNGCGRE